MFPPIFRKPIEKIKTWVVFTPVFLIIFSCGTMIQRDQMLSIVSDKTNSDPIPIFDSIDTSSNKQKKIGSTPMFYVTDRKKVQTFYSLWNGEARKHSFDCSIRWGESVIPNGMFALFFSSYLVPSIVILAGYDFISGNMYDCGEELKIAREPNIRRGKSISFCPKVVVFPPYREDKLVADYLAIKWIEKAKKTGCAEFMYSKETLSILSRLNVDHTRRIKEDSLSFEVRKKIGVAAGASYFAVIESRDFRDTTFARAEIKSLHNLEGLKSYKTIKTEIKTKQIRSHVSSTPLNEYLKSKLPNSIIAGLGINRMGFPESARGYVIKDHSEDFRSFFVGLSKIDHPDGFGVWDYQYYLSPGFDLNLVHFKTDLIRDNFYDDALLDERLDGQQLFSYKGDLGEARAFYKLGVNVYTPMGTYSAFLAGGLSLIHYTDNLDVAKTTLMPIVGTELGWSVFLSKNSFGYVNYSLWELHSNLFQGSNSKSRTDNPGSLYFKVRKNYAIKLGLGYMIP